MKKRRSMHEISRIVKEAEAAPDIAAFCLHHGIEEKTLQRWQREIDRRLSVAEEATCHEEPSEKKVRIILDVTIQVSVEQ
jgi:hypothetical protein